MHVRIFGRREKLHRFIHSTKLVRYTTGTCTVKEGRKVNSLSAQ